MAGAARSRLRTFAPVARLRAAADWWHPADYENAADLERKADTDEARRASREEQVRLLDDMHRAIEPYRGELDPWGATLAQIEIMVEQIRNPERVERQP